MLAISQIHPGAIIAGVTRDPLTGRVTYGGRMRIDRHPQRFFLLPASASVVPIDGFDGNCVLIPKSARLAVGPIDGQFPHAFADDDYGQRAARLGISLLQAPDTIGICCNNHVGSAPKGVLNRWRYFESPKRLPWRAQWRYMRRHGDRTWPFWFVASTAKRFLA